MSLLSLNEKKRLGEGRRWEGGLERGWFMGNAICGRGAAAPLEYQHLDFSPIVEDQNEA